MIACWSSPHFAKPHVSFCFFSVLRSISLKIMKVRLTQIDGKLRNLALMKMAYWHKSKGDEVFFESSINKSMFEPDYDIVYGSAIFSSSEKKIELFKIQFPSAIIGGTGYDMTTKVEHLIG